MWGGLKGAHRAELGEGWECLRGPSGTTSIFEGITVLRPFHML